VKVKKDVKHNFFVLWPCIGSTQPQIGTICKDDEVHTHKHMEDGISDIFNIMTKNGVPH
jgi:hypothetical protein